MTICRNTTVDAPPKPNLDSVALIAPHIPLSPRREGRRGAAPVTLSPGHSSNVNHCRAIIWGTRIKKFAAKIVVHQACHHFVTCDLLARDRARELHEATVCMTRISPDTWVPDDDLTIGKRGEQRQS